MGSHLPRDRRAALDLAAAWMGERYFRTFRLADEDPAPFDAILRQRDRRIGVTVATLWDEGAPPLEGARELEELVTEDVEEGRGYVLWVPPGATLPVDEPRRSDFRLLVAHGVSGLQPAERREIRLPATLRLAKIDAGGAYISVTGGLSSQWTVLSSAVQGAFHLDSREIHRLPTEPAELEIIMSRVKDRAGLLEPQEVTDIQVHDYWLVSRLPGDSPPGLTVVAAPPTHDPQDGTIVRRTLRAATRRATEQRAAAGEDVEFTVLVVLASLGRIEGELATASLRGMAHTAYGNIDLITLVADGKGRQILQPRQLPWER